MRSSYEDYERSPGAGAVNVRPQGNDQRYWVSVLQVFPFGENGYAESTSVRVAIIGDAAQRISCKLTGSITAGRLRIDPCNHPALVEITRVAVSDQQGDTLWIAERLSANELTVTGTAVQLPGSRSLTLYSYGDDPQLLLPAIAAISCEQEYLLEIDLRINRDTASIVPFLRQTSSWTGRGADPDRVFSAMNLFERECAPASREKVYADPLHSARMLYLDLMKKCLTRFIFPDEAVEGDLAGQYPFDPQKRIEGLDWPTEADTMVGVRRLNNVQELAIEILREKIPGDFVEAGVWRGGVAIFMSAILAAFGDPDRQVWVADSFQGLPVSNPRDYPVDEGDQHFTLTPYLGVPAEQVKANFRRYGLLGSQVKLLEGYFKDTLHASPIAQIALLRVDGDMYESTIQVLQALYPRVSRGGYVIIDDFGALPGCRQAVLDYRAQEGIESPIVEVDWTGVYWRRE